MSLRKWSDSKGWARGAIGIDDEKGANFTQEGNSVAANKFAFGRCWEFDGKAPAGEHNAPGDGKAKESPDYDTK